ncbi:MAG: ORF6N domain-containing protein [Nanobdellota archaeon]
MQLQEIGDIKSKIHTIRGKQVMLDRDLAGLYGVETRALNQSVKRNASRFPSDFCFQLDAEEFNNWKSQFVISNKEKMGLRKLPYAFTQEGVASLSGVLKSEKASQVNVKIMRAFVAMRTFLLQNASVFQKFQQIDQKLLEHDQNFEKVFDAIQDNQIIPEKGIFFEGQVFDAHKFTTDLISSAKESIIIIDNYIDSSVLTMLSYKKEDVNVRIYTKDISDKLNLAKDKFNKQYKNLEIKKFTKAHDRFLIIDNKGTYHIGASLKDLGKRWFAFSKLNKDTLKLLENLQ